MQKTVQMIKEYIEKNQMICSGDRILIGVSGGADSVCLLRVLSSLSKELDIQIGAIHVNHQIRKEAGEDEAFVEALCEELSVPCDVRRVDVMQYARQEHLSSEEAGRILRYQIFRQMMDAENYNKLAVAHHANDNAETILLNLFRGTGLNGLTGIRPIRDNVIRPLLCVTRQQIEAYLTELGQAYCTDATNQTDDYTRNKLRNHIFPYIQNEITPQVITRMNETAMQMVELRDYLERQTLLYYEDCVREKEQECVVNLDVWYSLDSVIQKQILLKCLDNLTPHKKDITSKHVNAVMELCFSNSGKEIHLPYQICVKKIYHQLRFEKVETDNLENLANEENKYFEVLLEKNKSQTDTETEIVWNHNTRFWFRLIEGESIQNIPRNQYTKWFDYDKIKTSVAIRNRVEGDYFICDSDGHRKTLKSYMINEKIPRDKRDKMCVVAEGNHVLWLPGYRISEYYKIDQNTKRILEIRLQEDKNG